MDTRRGRRKAVHHVDAPLIREQTEQAPPGVQSSSGEVLAETSRSSRRASLPALQTVPEHGLALSTAATRAEDRRALLRQKFAKLRTNIVEEVTGGNLQAGTEPRQQSMSAAIGHPPAVEDFSQTSASAPSIDGDCNAEDALPRAKDLPAEPWNSLNSALAQLTGTTSAARSFRSILRDPAQAEGRRLRRVVEDNSHTPWLSAAAAEGETRDMLVPDGAGGYKLVQQRVYENDQHNLAAGAQAQLLVPAVSPAAMLRGREGNRLQTAVNSGSSTAHTGSSGGGSSGATVPRARALSLNDSDHLAEDVVSAVLADPRTTLAVGSSTRSVEGVDYYAVVVLGESDEWTVFRRFSQFERLQAALTRSAAAAVAAGTVSQTDLDATGMAALLSNVLPGKTWGRATEIDVQTRRVVLHAWIRELWGCEATHLSDALRSFLRPGGGAPSLGAADQQAAAAMVGSGVATGSSGRGGADVASVMGTTAGWLRVLRICEYSSSDGVQVGEQEGEPQRRWVVLNGAGDAAGAATSTGTGSSAGDWAAALFRAAGGDSSSGRSSATLSYARRPGDDAGARPLRSIALHQAALSPCSLRLNGARRGYSFELISARERVLFVAETEAQCNHWLAVVRPHLPPSAPLEHDRHSSGSQQLGNEPAEPAAQWTKKELRRRARLCGVESQLIVDAMDAEGDQQAKQRLLELITFHRYWEIGGRRLGPLGSDHVGPHWLSRPATVPDHTRARAQDFAAFSKPPGAREEAEGAAAGARGRAMAQRRATLRRLQSEVAELQAPLLQLAVGQACERAIALYSEDASGLCARAVAKHALGDWAAAQVDFKLALAVQPFHEPTMEAYERAQIKAAARAASHRAFSHRMSVASGAAHAPSGGGKFGATGGASIEQQQAVATGDPRRSSGSTVPSPSPSSYILLEAQQPDDATTGELQDSSTRDARQISPPRSPYSRGGGGGGGGGRLGSVAAEISSPSAGTLHSRSRRRMHVPDGVPVVVDCGSAMLRAGFAGEGLPRVVAAMDGGRQVGGCTSLASSPLLTDPATSSRTMLSPVMAAAADAARGVPASRNMEAPFSIDWALLEETWDSLFTGALEIEPSETTFVMSSLPDMRPASRATAIEILFESFDVPCLRMESPAVLSLYAAGVSSGLVIDLGARLTITPIVEGYVLQSAEHRSFVGGLAVTEELMRLLMDSGVDARLLSGGGGGGGGGQSAAINSVRKLKERHGQILSKTEVAAQWGKQQGGGSTAEPRGDEVTWRFGDSSRQRGSSAVAAQHLLRRQLPTALRSEPVACGGAGELWRAPELLFSDLGDGRGLAAHAVDVVGRCDIAARSLLMGNVLLSGGSTCFPGFQGRLQEELSASWAPPSSSSSSQGGGGSGSSGGRRSTEGVTRERCRVVAPANRRYSAWLGGEALAGLPSFGDSLLWRQEWEEEGADRMVAASYGAMPS